VTTDNPVVCRCEDIHLDAVQSCIADGATTAFEVKMATRAGMGPCQGRVCRLAVEQLLELDDAVVDDSSEMSVRYPVRPVRMSDLAGIGEAP